MDWNWRRYIERKFKQKEVLKPCLEFSTEKRRNARNDFEKDIFKVLISAVLEKPRKIRENKQILRYQVMEEG